MKITYKKLTNEFLPTMLRIDIITKRTTYRFKLFQPCIFKTYKRNNVDHFTNIKKAFDNIPDERKKELLELFKQR